MRSAIIAMAFITAATLIGCEQASSGADDPVVGVQAAQAREITELQTDLKNAMNDIEQLTEVASDEFVVLSRLCSHAPKGTCQDEEEKTPQHQRFQANPKGQDTKTAKVDR